MKQDVLLKALEQRRRQMREIFQELMLVLEQNDLHERVEFLTMKQIVGAKAYGIADQDLVNNQIWCTQS
jgi:hypothetical protein